MLRLIEKTSDKRKAHALLAQTLTEQLPSLGRHTVTFRPGSMELSLRGVGPGSFYAGWGRDREASRLWSTFGVFNPAASKQEIVVQVNVSTAGGREAGAFGCDAAGRIYLMHSGGIGGGREGIGRTNFLAWLKPEPELLMDENGGVHPMILIGELASHRFAQRIESFVSSVRSFKAAQASGELNAPAFTGVAAEWRAYLKEFSGRKVGSVNTNLDCVSYHGDVVDALRATLDKSNRPGTVVTNSRLIDLLIHRSHALTDVFEVKTSSDRQSIYTALGQLLVHAPSGAAVRRHLVVPNDSPLPPDIIAALASNAIEVRRFEITQTGEVSFSPE